MATSAERFGMESSVPAGNPPRGLTMVSAGHPPRSAPGSGPPGRRLGRDRGVARRCTPRPGGAGGARPE